MTISPNHPFILPCGIIYSYAPFCVNSNGLYLISNILSRLFFLQKLCECHNLTAIAFEYSSLLSILRICNPQTKLASIWVSLAKTSVSWHKLFCEIPLFLLCCSSINKVVKKLVVDDNLSQSYFYTSMWHYLFLCTLLCQLQWIVFNF